MATKCCPEGYPYYDALRNLCANIENKLIEPLTNGDCPCCPPGTIFDITRSANPEKCLVNGTFDVWLETIPCIACEPCVTPPEFECPDCSENKGLSIHMTLNLNEKVCEDCIKPEFVLPDNSSLKAFLPYFLILPNTNKFKYRS